MKEKFYDTDYEEQETIVNIDYFKSEIYLYTSRKAVYKRIEEKLGEPKKIFYVHKKISGAYWNIPFGDKRKLTSVLSRPMLIGNVK